MKERFNTRSKLVANPGFAPSEALYAAQFRPVGRKHWTTIKSHDRRATAMLFATARDANIAAIEHVGTLGGLCSYEGMR